MAKNVLVLLLCVAYAVANVSAFGGEEGAERWKEYKDLLGDPVCKPNEKSPKDCEKFNECLKDKCKEKLDTCDIEEIKDKCKKFGREDMKGFTVCMGKSKGSINENGSCNVEVLKSDITAAATYDNTKVQEEVLKNVDDCITEKGSGECSEVIKCLFMKSMKTCHPNANWEEIKKLREKNKQ